MGNNNKDVADSIIKNHMIWAMGAGLIPVPLADLVAVTYIQLDMIRQIAKVYDVDYKETEGKAMVTSMTSAGLSKLGARAIKLIPVVGTVLGGVTIAVLSGASTYALGEVFSKHFETGGTFLDFDPTRLKKFYNEKFEKGKKMAEEIRKEKIVEKEIVENHKKKEDTKDIIQRIKEIAKLHDDGIINDDEFLKLKKELIG